MNHSQTIPLPNAMLLLMAMLEDRREPLAAAVQRRAVLGALKSWASGGLPTPTAVEQAFDDAQEVLARFLAYRSADSATPVAVEVTEVSPPTRCACLTPGRVGHAADACVLCNQQHKTVTSALGRRS